MAIQIRISTASSTEGEEGIIAVAVFEGGLDKQKHLTAVDNALGGALLAHASNIEFRGKPNQLLDLPTHGKINARRVLLIGLGSKKGLDAARIRHALATVVRAAGSVPKLAIALPERIQGEELGAVGEAVVYGSYRFTKYFTGDRLPKSRLEAVSIYRAGKSSAADNKLLAKGKAVGEAVCVARDAVNEPPNEFTPKELAAWATKICKEGSLKIKVLDKAGIKKAGMHLHYAVGQGSVNEPRFVHMTYAPKKPKGKLVFVGKGLTFDAGGLCIKPAAGMGDMKSDMGGAAAVLGLMKAVAAVKPNVEVHGIIGSAENMPDAAAYRPGDVFGSLDGRSVEIINTDAEGRLVLADALTYATRLNPDLIVDAATLTGACVVALGKQYSAYYTMDEKLAKRFGASAKTAGESFWRMPLVEEMREQLKSDVADLKHTGERWGGSISAALFLREFTADVPWIHCDVAAPVLFDRARGMYPKGGTGHPVLTFLDLVENWSK